ncbi:MAG: glycosyltransferase [Candidatus Micrarchaeia archaeon]
MPAKTLRVSIIVPTLNEETRIRDTLASLRRAAPGAEIIVSDGASTDRTVALARKAGARVVFEAKDPKRRKSIGAGRNKGARAARGEILWFVDADTRPEPAFYKSMLRAFADPQVVGAGCKIMPRDASFMDEALFEFLNLLVFSSIVVGRPTIAGNCVAYRRDAFFEIKGFDEEMEASEDQDLCIRISRLGRVVYMKDVTATTSSRRLKKMGWLGLAADWGKTTLNFLFGKKNRSYAIVREG